MSRRECYSCGALAGEAVFPARTRGRKDLCTDCVAELVKPPRDGLPARPAIRRASAMAAARRRQQSKQLDMFDPAGSA
jgi:hypothetical protein